MSPPRPLLIVLAGPVGSGKSRLASRIAAQLGYTVVANDEIRGKLFSSPSFCDEENQAVYSAALDLVECSLAAGSNVVYDGTNMAGDVRERVRRRAEPLAEVIFVVTCVSDDVCRNRLAHRPEGGDHWWAVYQELCTRMQPLQWSFVLADGTQSDEALLQLLRRLTVRPK